MMSKMLLKYIKISRLGDIFCRSTKGYVISETYDWAFLSRVQLPFYWTHLNYKILNLLWTTDKPRLFCYKRRHRNLWSIFLQINANHSLKRPSFPGKKIWMFPQQGWTQFVFASLVTHLELATLVAGGLCKPSASWSLHHEVQINCERRISKEILALRIMGSQKLMIWRSPNTLLIQTQTHLFWSVPADS